MAKNEVNTVQKIGSWAFVIGIIIAIIAGLANQGQTSALTTSVLMILGLIVGFLNITGKETSMFLLAGVSLVIVTNFSSATLAQVQVVGLALAGILDSIMIFVVPAVIIVALKAVWALAADQ